MKAISLISGGLDSELATRIILEQKIEVIGLHFVTPFCLCDKKGSCNSQSLRVAKNLNIELKIIPLKDEYLEIVKNPKYGYGKNLNPCIDCRIMMLRYAKKIMQEVGASFVVTGEVLEQRPKSQNIKALKIIEKESGLEGLILRPLSAKVLPETIPEKLGWVQREKLFNIIGRQRKIQIELAKNFDMKNYPCPSGGCLLTDPNFSKRIKDVLINCGDLTIYDVNLAKVGRHFRLDEKTKVIVGRNEKENNILTTLKRDKDLILLPKNTKGPIGLVIGELDDRKILYSASIVASYCDGKENHTEIFVIPEEKLIVAEKLPKSELEVIRVEKLLS